MILALWAIAVAIVFAAWKASRMTTAIEDLTSHVDRATTVAAGAVTLIGGLAQQLRDNANDPAAIEALADKLDASSDALAAAVEANTPASPDGGDVTGSSDATEQSQA